MPTIVVSTPERSVSEVYIMLFEKSRLRITFTTLSNEPSVCHNILLKSILDFIKARITSPYSPKIDLIYSQAFPSVATTALSASLNEVMTAFIFSNLGAFFAIFSVSTAAFSNPP